MPIHDWTRVSDGTFHAFFVSWVSALQESLNSGILPPPYYAQAEQIVDTLGPDVLTLQTNGYAVIETTSSGQAGAGGLAVATVPPCRIIALVEIVSPGNKSSRHALRSFVDKAVEALYRGYHLLIVDLVPPTPRDPQGIHGAIWREISNDSFKLPGDEPLTLAAYSAGPVKRAWIEPTAVGRALIKMPLFLEPEIYVNVPLEATYQAAYRGVAQRWKQVLE